MITGGIIAGFFQCGGRPGAGYRTPASDAEVDAGQGDAALPVQPISFAEADILVQQTACNYPVKHLQASHFSNNQLFGLCGMRLPDLMRSHALFTMTTEQNPPTTNVANFFTSPVAFRPDSPEALYTIEGIAEIGPGLYAANKKALTATARPDRLIVLNANGDIIQELIPNSVQFQEPRPNSRGENVATLEPDYITALHFDPIASTLFVTARNLICPQLEACTFENAIYNPGTILTFQENAEGDLIQQATFFRTSQFNPSQALLAGREQDKLVVFNTLDPSSIDIFSSRSGEQLRTFMLRDLHPNLELSFSFSENPVAVSPDGVLVAFEIYTSDITENRQSTFAVLNMDDLTIISDWEAISDKMGDFPKVSPESLLVDNEAWIYATDSAHNFTAVFQRNPVNRQITFEGYIGHNPDCFSFEQTEEGFSFLVGGENCGNAGAAFISNNILYQAIDSYITRFALPFPNP